MSLPLWKELLHNAIKATNKTKVAEKLGYDRSTISQIANEKYPASTEHVAKMVLSVYGRITCPHLDSEITQHECDYHQTRNAPTSSPREMKHWRACQSCERNQALCANVTQGEKS